MELTGACHCKAITFKTQGDARRAVICHCRDCQVMSGGPYRSIIQTQEADFELLSGSPKLYHKYGDSGARRELAFCDQCGSHLYATSVKEDVPIGQRALGLRTGILDQVSELPPQIQVWCLSKVAWADNISALPSKDKQ